MTLTHSLTNINYRVQLSEKLIFKSIYEESFEFDFYHLRFTKI